MEKKYIAPSAEVVFFKTEDILKLSGELDGEEPKKGTAPEFDFDSIFGLN